MESPVIDPQEGFKCLRFWFFSTSTIIQLYSIKISDLSRKKLWFHNKLTKSWSFMQIPLQTQHEYKLLFKTNRQVKEIKLVVAVDDIVLSRDSCQNATSMNINCKMRTTQGDCCSFPFIYKDKCYSYCIGVDGVKPWCSLTDNYDRDGQKGFCVGGNTALKAPLAPTQRTCRIMTDSGKMCVFPFKYNNRFHSQCLTTTRKPWCATTLDLDVAINEWGFCNYTSLDQCGLCKQKTTNNQCCVFPFIYEARKYYSCTVTNFDRYWCSLTENYDRNEMFGVCSGYENHVDCRVNYGKQKPTPQWTPVRGSPSNVMWSPRLSSSDVVFNQDNVNGSIIDITSGLFEISFNVVSTKALVTFIIPDLETFTACVWMKTNDTVNQGTPFRYHGTNTTGFGLINYKNIAIRLMGKEKKSSVSANDGRWHHLCLVWTSKGGVYQMYKDGMFVIQGNDWHKDQKIPGGGSILLVGADNFVGKISGMNVWTVAMGLSEIAQRAVGCGIEGGDIVDWSTFSNRQDVVYPPTCLDVGGKGYLITLNSTKQTASDLISNVFNSPLADYSISLCFYFRYMVIGHSNASLKIYRSDLKDLDTNTTNEELVWAVSSKTSLPLWRFGTVSLSALQTFKIKVSATVGLGQGSFGLAGYFAKPGYCPSFSKCEIRGCQVQLASQSGTFTSPYFPDLYPNNIQCKWWISRPNGYVIRLKFLSFELQDSQSCEDNYVVVYDGSSSSSKILGRYCGDSFPLLLESSSNSLLIVFMSDNERSLSGFKMSYSSHIKETEDCNFIENCPPSCTCSAVLGNPPPVSIICKGLTAIPMKTPVNTIAMMISKNRLSRIEYSIYSDLQYMDLSHNYIMSVTPYSFTGLKNMTTLRLDFNFIKELQPNVFTGSSRLQKLDLGSNLLSTIKYKSLYNLQNLQVLSLRSNQISHIEKQAFGFVKNLTHLYLQNNLIEALPDGVFDSLESLKVLYLNNNKLKKVSKNTFRSLRYLEELYLDKNPIQSIDETTFGHLQNLRLLKLDRFVFCCYAYNSIKGLTCKSPSSAFSSCDNLMKNKTLQICIWILGILAFVGNIGVIIWRLIVKERNRVHSFLLTNLAISDLMMGVYLLMIAIKDLEWRGVYFKNDLQWRSSRVCQLAGALSVISSEVSVLILTTITADRYATIVFAFKFKRLKMKSAALVVTLIWIFGFVIALFPMLYSDYFYDYDGQVGFYGRSGVCLPLQLSHERFPGWEYSVAIFIGLNFIAFSFILVAYIIMFWKVRSSSRSVRSTQMNTESALARKMAFIILTDFCCWMPIIIIGVLSLLGKFPDPEKLAYVWIAVFVLPVNSSINPVLYTFSNCSLSNKKESIITSIKRRFTHAVSQGTFGL
ncbi:uncharacterized protein LOC116295583 [Actinia tenebrosa]|uniref:Uncharacterized protein LOC116295583 n=1 Tax=Actinia tenebrosa TaxID=6105 RepID=A0A6P8I391_ACTTE|nr:uncharacterized protein LOC116295583 [Actinia tenebrosa]